MLLNKGHVGLGIVVDVIFRVDMLGKTTVTVKPMVKNMLVLAEITQGKIQEGREV